MNTTLEVEDSPGIVYNMTENLLPKSLQMQSGEEMCL